MMNIQEPWKTLLIAIVPASIIAIITEVTNFFDKYELVMGYKILIIMAIYFVAVILILILNIIWSGWFKARYDLWRIGKIRGLWREKGLIKQIHHCFATSHIIKIKVTRGIDLLSTDNDYGFRDILDNLKMGKGKKHKEKVEIQFLLMLPCFQEEHVRERYERHTDMTEEEFLETWYDFLKQIRGYITDNLSINVRFYFGSHARWRFYIFSKPAGAKTDVLLSSYEKKTPGSSEPMYKIIKGEQNIGAFMTNYFDEIWKTALTPQKLYKYINNGRCENGFCTYCTREKENSCVACDRNNCSYEASCGELIKKYKKILESFNAR